MTDFDEEMKDLITKGVEKAIEKAKEAVRQSLAEWAIERQTKAAKQTKQVMGLQLSHVPNEDEGEENDKSEESTQETYSDVSKLLTEVPALQVFEEKPERVFVQKAPLSISKAADVILWRNKQLSASMLAASTVIWLLFERVGYHVLSFVCNSLILSLAALFLWSNLSSFLNKSPPVFPELSLPEDVTMKVALLLRHYVNKAIMVLADVASKRDVKKFLYVVLGLYVVSVVGSWFNFLTLVYIISVIVLTIPWLYEKNEDRVDDYATKAKGKLKRQYDALDDKVLQKLPKMPSFRKDKKQD